MKLGKIGGSDVNITPIGLKHGQWATANGNSPGCAGSFSMAISGSGATRSAHCRGTELAARSTCRHGKRPYRQT
jgi:hypothetical protein